MRSFFHQVLPVVCLCSVCSISAYEEVVPHADSNHHPQHQSADKFLIKDKTNLLSGYLLSSYSSISNNDLESKYLDRTSSSSYFIKTTRRQLEEGEGDGDHHEEDGEHHEEDGDHDGETTGGPKPWGKVLGGTFLVNLATLTGVIFLIPVCSFKGSSEDKNEAAFIARQARRQKILDIIVPSFAAGALLATAVFLIGPESIVLIQRSLTMEEGGEGDGHDADHRFLEGEEGGHDDHGFEILPATTWRFATTLLSGFLVPIVFAVFVPRHVHNVDTQEQYNNDHSKNKFEEDLEGHSTEEESEEGESSKKKNWTLALSILV